MLLFQISAFGQSDVHYSMFKLNRQIFNPAVTGANKSMTFTMHRRDQWGNFPGAPKTWTFQGHTPVFHEKVGLGISFISEEIGIYKTNMVSLNYAYHISLGEKSMLRIGGLAEFSHATVRWEMADALDLQDVTLGVSESRTRANAGAGIFYELGEFYVGFSIPKLLINNLYSESGAIPSSVLNLRTYYFQIGTAFQLRENLALSPGILIATNPSAPFEFDVNVNLLMFDKIGVGFAYRFQDSADAILQYKLNNQFKIAAGFDFTVSGLQESAPSSYEVLMQYELKYENNGIHNIRFF